MPHFRSLHWLCLLGVITKLACFLVYSTQAAVFSGLVFRENSRIQTLSVPGLYLALSVFRPGRASPKSVILAVSKDLALSVFRPGRASPKPIILAVSKGLALSVFRPGRASPQPVILAVSKANIL